MAGAPQPLIAICAGVILDRMLLGHTELNSPGTENLIPYLHAALDAVSNLPPAGSFVGDAESRVNGTQ